MFTELMASGSGGSDGNVEIAYQARPTTSWVPNTLISKDQVQIATALDVEMVGSVIGFTPTTGQACTIRAIKDCTLYYCNNINATTNMTEYSMTSGETKSFGGLSNQFQSIYYAVEK